MCGDGQGCCGAGKSGHKAEGCGDKKSKCCNSEQDTGQTSAGGCEHPDKLQGKPGDCSPEQVSKCHGSGGDHPCTDGNN